MGKYWSRSWIQFLQICLFLYGHEVRSHFLATYYVWHPDVSPPAGRSDWLGIFQRAALCSTSPSCLGFNISASRCVMEESDPRGYLKIPPLPKCENNGTVSSDGITCVCLPGFTGKYCEDVFNECGGDTPLECLTSGDGVTYSGTLSTTILGLTCQRWDSDTPNSHPYSAAHQFPDATVACAENYCRNPDNSRTQAWCYTTTPGVTYDFCDIPLC